MSYIFRWAGALRPRLRRRRALVRLLVRAATLGTVLTPHVLLAQEPELYAIGPDDVLSIIVWNEPEVSGKFAVEADGAFTFPLIGRVVAAGSTIRDLEGELRRRLGAGYFKIPQVSVAVETYGSQRIFVMGEVHEPGMYSLRGKMLLIEALARAGATTEMAGEQAIVVRRPGRSVSGAVLPDEADDKSQMIHVDLQGLQRGELTESLVLRDGDTVFVPRAETVYVSGNVTDPGAYPIKKDMTVRQAVILAGGVTDRGSTGRMKIVRTLNGEKIEIRATEDDAVRRDDTIVVLQRIF